MNGRLYVGSRKGLFTISKSDGVWGIEQVDFLGEPATMFLQDPRDGALYCSLTLGHFGVKLHRSMDGGSGWSECGVPKFPEGSIVPDGFPEDGKPMPTKLASLSEIWSLEAGGSDGTLWAGTIPGALFQSKDCGETWDLVESLWNRPERMEWFGGGKDESGLHSICVNPANEDQITIAISCGGVWTTDDRGDSWRLIGNGQRAEYLPPDLAENPNTQDPHRLAVSPTDPNVMWIQHHNGIFYSNDAGENFTELTDTRPSGFGFAVAVHPNDPETAWFVPAVKDECRVPVNGELVVTRTRNAGTDFETLRNGLPQEHCYDLVLRHALDVDSSGDLLAMGSTTGGLWVSEDSGDSWVCVSQSLPPIYCVRFAR